MSGEGVGGSLRWRVGSREFDLSRSGLVMGILNVTPDSFSDGGQFLDVDAAVRHAVGLVADGADLIDVGGESTRPGAAVVDAEEELRRVCPVIREIAASCGVPVSIDTSKALVAAAAIEAGAVIVNDVTALGGDPEMAAVVRDSGVGVVLMHMRGTPRTMQHDLWYGGVLGVEGVGAEKSEVSGVGGCRRDGGAPSVVAVVRDFLRQRFEQAVTCGIDPMRIALDPGIGFGKTAEDNFSLLNHCAEFSVGGQPVLIGVSRKSLFRAVVGDSDMEDRFWPGVATTSFCRERGARIFRVHDPKPHRQALRMTEAILHSA